MTSILPDLSSFSPVSTLTAPADVNTVWTPTMTGSNDYQLDAGASARHRRITIGSGGRIAWLTGAVIDIEIDSGPMIELLNGIDYVVLEGCLLTNTGEFFSDGIRGGRTGSSTTVSSSTNAFGGNAYTGAGGGTLILWRTRIEGLCGSNGSSVEFPTNPDPEVHADGIQYPGGVYEMYAEDCTIQSAYVGVQGQDEQFVTGTTASLTAATYDAVNGRMDLTFSDPLNLDPSHNEKMWVAIKDATPTTWRGTYRLHSILTGSAGAATKVRVHAPYSSPTAYTGSGTARQSRWIYYVGSHRWNRVNFLRHDNRADVLDPDETLSAFRVPGSGRPAPNYKASGAEDRFEGIHYTFDATGKVFEVHDVYVEPNSGEDLLDMIEPSGSGVPDLFEMELVDAATDYVRWPNQSAYIRDALTHTNVGGDEARVYTGTPPGGDYAPANKVGFDYDPDDPFWPSESSPPPASGSLLGRRRFA